MFGPFFFFSSPSLLLRGESDIFQREIIQGFLSWWTLELKRLKARKAIGSKWFLLPIWETCREKIMAHNIQR